MEALWTLAGAGRTVVRWGDGGTAHGGGGGGGTARCLLGCAGSRPHLPRSGLTPSLPAPALQVCTIHQVMRGLATPCQPWKPFIVLRPAAGAVAACLGCCMQCSPRSTAEPTLPAVCAPPLETRDGAAPLQHLPGDACGELVRVPHSSTCPCVAASLCCHRQPCAVLQRTQAQTQPP